ncbi:hypothetical protein XNA1_2230008 [Xenorhabdus nematophila str. Anatoliense]|nr:hypothetical protein XNA1_2230008 [Xenorhabdus nematophila str. Anatoliense]
MPVCFRVRTRAVGYVPTNEPYENMNTPLSGPLGQQGIELGALKCLVNTLSKNWKSLLRDDITFFDYFCTRPPHVHAVN